MSDKTEIEVEELSKAVPGQYDMSPNSTLDEDERKEHLRSLKQDTDERKRYANKLFWFLVAYMVLVFIILFFHGFSLAGFHIDDTVTIALISTTTANIIAVFVFVVKYLFHFKIDGRLKCGTFARKTGHFCVAIAVP